MWTYVTMIFKKKIEKNWSKYFMLFCKTVVFSLLIFHVLSWLRLVITSMLKGKWFLGESVVVESEWLQAYWIHINKLISETPSVFLII